METPNWTQGSLQVNDISIHYYRTSPSVQGSSLGSTPSTIPILIILHSLLGSGAMTIPVATDLATRLNIIREFDIIVPDARGHGGSQPLPIGSFRRKQLVEDAITIVKHFSRGHKVFLLGHSMGASTAAQVAKSHPELITALILEEPPWRRGEGKPVDPKQRTLPRNLLDRIKALKNMTDEEFNRIDTDAAELPQYAQSSMAASRAFDVTDCEATFYMCDDELNEAVEGLIVPTLLQHGDPETGSQLDLHVMDQVISTWPYREVSHYPQGSHFLHLGIYAHRWIREVARFIQTFSEAVNLQEQE